MTLCEKFFAALDAGYMPRVRGNMMFSWTHYWSNKVTVCWEEHHES